MAILNIISPFLLKKFNILGKNDKIPHILNWLLWYLWKKTQL